jgi:hypothetical protein
MVTGDILLVQTMVVNSLNALCNDVGSVLFAQFRWRCALPQLADVPQFFDARDLVDILQQQFPFHVDKRWLPSHCGAKGVGAVHLILSEARFQMHEQRGHHLYQLPQRSGNIDIEATYVEVAFLVFNTR